MRRILAPIIALAVHALARALPVETGFPSISRQVTFTAANGSDVVLNIGHGFGIVEDPRDAPLPISKHIKLVAGAGYLEVCTVRASKKAGEGMPLRNDCQALHDYMEHRNIFVYFEDFDADLSRWAEIFWVGSCAFRAQTSARHIVFSNADVARFLDTALSRPAWTVDGRMSASGEADCAAMDGSYGFAPMFWRLQERYGVWTKAVDDDDSSLLKDRDVDRNEPLVVESLDQIPQNTSAYVCNHALHTFIATNATSSSELSKRFQLYTNGAAVGPFCDPIWMSSSWDEPNTPLKSDCNKLLDFVRKNTATVKFEDRDLNYLAKFAAHGTCGISFLTTKADLVISNRDMATFLERVLRWDVAYTEGGGIRGKMGVVCGLDASDKHEGEFRLFWRDPKLPIGQLERRTYTNPNSLTAEVKELVVGEV